MKCIFNFLLLIFGCDTKGICKANCASKINYIRLDEELYNAYPNNIAQLNLNLINDYGSIYEFYFSNILNEGSPYSKDADRI